jgi:hypothetical protein
MFESDFVQFTLTPVLAIIGAVFGLIGTGIGVFSIWLQWRSHATKVTVSYVLSDVSLSSNCLSASSEIVVSNHSSFAITVIEVGLLYKVTWFRRRYKSYPIKSTRIDARDVFKFHAYIPPKRTQPDGWASHQVWAEDLTNATGAYAMLVDGTKIRSNDISRKLDEIRVKILDYEKQNHPDSNARSSSGPY